MNINMNKKAFLIAGVVIIVLMIITLILIGVFSSTNKKETISYNLNNVTNDTEYPELPENETEENETENPGQREDDEGQITGEITKAQTDDGGTIPVPPTFNYIGGNSGDGAVIEDSNGNQFVWVPVENFNSYARQIFANNGRSFSRSLGLSKT